METAEITHRTDYPLLGNSLAVEFFENAVSRDRLAHAYLITGPSGVGTRALARAVAARLLGGNRSLDVHPDYMEIAQEHDEKTGNLNAGIRRHQAEALRERLASASMMGGWKVAVIDGADALLHDAANLLLKTIEEPFPRTLLFLLAESADTVMPTIRSRCQTVVMRTVPEKEIADALIARGVSGADASLIARLSDGRPERAFAFVADPGSLERLREHRSTLLAIPDVDLQSRWSALETMIPAKAAFNESKAYAEDVLRLLSELLRDALLNAYGEGDRMVHGDARNAVSRLMGGDVGRITAALGAVTEAKARIAANVNPKTALQHLFALL